jgi:anaerobic selenocysteine-containing dehydrogenase
MKPLHNTRAMPDVIIDAAHKLGGDFAKALPWNTYEEALKQSFSGLAKQPGSVTASDADSFWQEVQDKGGWWSTETLAPPTAQTRKPLAASVVAIAPEFDGKPADFPFHFLPFASQMLYDGSLANLPWLQEAPDPLSTAMWGSWVELNPETAAKAGIKQADMVEVRSQHGSLRAPALITPGIAPDVVAVPVGQGHENFTRYASGRGANPISILAPLGVNGTDALAWAATRVKIARVGTGELALFAGSLREVREELQQR